MVESLVARIAPAQRLEVGESHYDLLDPNRQCRLRLGDHHFGFLGELSALGRDRFELRGPSTVAELDLAVLIAAAELTPLSRSLSPFPPVGRDLNIVVPEPVRWGEVEALVRSAGGDLLESITSI